MSQNSIQSARRNALCRCVVIAPDTQYRIPQAGCLYCLGTGLRDVDREKVIVRNATRRVPTPEEFLAFDGAHCKQLYRRLDASWCCPSCRRSKFELLRWTLLFPHTLTPYEGWAMGLHAHHDHRADSVWINGQLQRSSWPPRFPETVICEQCNAADASAKRKLKLPKSFSYSPVEIGSFVTATPHGWHLLNYQLAQRIFESITQVPPPPPVPWPSLK